VKTADAYVVVGMPVGLKVFWCVHQRNSLSRLPRVFSGVSEGFFCCGLWALGFGSNETLLSSFL